MNVPQVNCDLIRECKSVRNRIFFLLGISAILNLVVVSLSAQVDCLSVSVRSGEKVSLSLMVTASNFKQRLTKIKPDYFCVMSFGDYCV